MSPLRAPSIVTGQAGEPRWRVEPGGQVSLTMNWRSNVSLYPGDLLSLTIDMTPGQFYQQLQKQLDLVKEIAAGS